MIGQIIEELKRINKKNYDVELITSGEIKLHMKLTPEEFEEFVNWLRSKGFINVNGARNRVNDFIDYKEDYVFDEFENLKTGKKIELEYVDVKSKEDFVVLKRIEVE
jgi:hypothetical protein